MRRGFTLLEILLVICIISILVALTVVGVVYALKTAKISNTQAEISTIQGALDNYHTRWRDYPPSTLARYSGISMPSNNSNNGIESLVASLSSKSKGGTLYRPPDQEMYLNVDNDELSKNPTQSEIVESGSYPLLEYSDFFGQPLLYLHHNDFRNPGPAVASYVMKSGGEEQTFKPYKGPGNSFAMPDKFQLVSAGADGIPGTEDDIKGF